MEKIHGVNRLFRNNGFKYVVGLVAVILVINFAITPNIKINKKLNGNNALARPTTDLVGKKLNNFQLDFIDSVKSFTGDTVFNIYVYTDYGDKKTKIYLQLKNLILDSLIVKDSYGIENHEKMDAVLKVIEYSQLSGLGHKRKLLLILGVHNNKLKIAAHYPILDLFNLEDLQFNHSLIDTSSYTLSNFQLILNRNFNSLGSYENNNFHEVIKLDFNSQLKIFSNAKITLSNVNIFNKEDLISGEYYSIKDRTNEYVFLDGIWYNLNDSLNMLIPML